MRSPDIEAARAGRCTELRFSCNSPLAPTLSRQMKLLRSHFVAAVLGGLVVAGAFLALGITGRRVDPDDRRGGPDRGAAGLQREQPG